MERCLKLKINWKSLKNPKTHATVPKEMTLEGTLCCAPGPSEGVLGRGAVPPWGGVARCCHTLMVFISDGWWLTVVIGDG